MSLNKENETETEPGWNSKKYYSTLPRYPEMKPHHQCYTEDTYYAAFQFWTGGVPMV